MALDLKQLIHSENAANIMLVVSAADLKTLLDDAINFAIKTNKEREEPSYYTRQELADKLHISLVTLNRWRDNGLLPEPVIIDRHVLYDKAKVRNTLANNKKIYRKLTLNRVAL